MTSSHDRFFIVGCQRSGTTLLRLVLECHSEIQCYDEYMAYRVLYGEESLQSDRPLVGFKVPFLTEQLTEWAGSLPDVGSPYAGEKLLFMVRDVRDTIVSMFRLRMNDDGWFEACGLPPLMRRIRLLESFRERYAEQLERIEQARNKRAAYAALYWRYKVDSSAEYVKRGFPLLQICYERMVREPRQELGRICEFLNVPWEDALLAHPAAVHGELNDAGLAVGETDPSRAIDEDSVGQWKRLLPAEDLPDILDIAGPHQAALYPES